MYLVSSCLGGINCRYNGKSSEDSFIIDLIKEGRAIPLCPECIGGLPIPRDPSEIINNKVITNKGQDVTKEFTLGAEKILQICKLLNIKKAILKARSPSCGYLSIYDGSFSGKLIKRNGITADLLIKNHIKIYTENDIEALKAELRV